MAKKPTSSVTTTTTPTKSAETTIKNPREVAVPADLADVDGIPAITMVKVKGGYVVVALTIEDWRVVDAEILTEGGGPVPRHHAEDVFRVECAQRILFPEWDAKDFNQ